MSDSNVRPIDQSPPRTPPHNGNQSFRWDLTINIPTMLTIMAMVVGMVTFGINKYNELTAADSSLARDVLSLQMEVTRLQGSQGGMVTEMRTAIDAMRKENREDLREIRGNLERINDRLPYVSGATNNLKGWTK